MAQAGAIVYYIAIGAMAAGEVYQAKTTAENAAERIRQLKNEKKNAELAVLDEEVNRMRMLREANADAIARAGNLDPYGSPSLLALRQVNFRMANEDVKNLYANLATERAQISAMIAINKQNIKSARVQGLLGAVSALGQGYVTGAKTFSKAPLDESTATTATPTASHTRKRRKPSFRGITGMGPGGFFGG